MTPVEASNLSIHLTFTGVALGPVHPGLHEGDELEIHARVRNISDRTAAVEWDLEQRRLAPSESWVRRDLRHRISAQDLHDGAAIVRTAPSVEGRWSPVALRIPTTPRPPG